MHVLPVTLTGFAVVDVVSATLVETVSDVVDDSVVTVDKVTSTAYVIRQIIILFTVPHNKVTMPLF